MDSTGSVGKKIVFKRRVLGVASAATDAVVDSAQPELLEVAQEPVDQATLQYHGEIFDQFYRPLSNAGADERLAELALEALAPPSPTRRLTTTEFEQEQSDIRAAGEAIAHQIYTLAQKARETEIDIYLSAFNVVLAERSCHDTKHILDAANDFFTEHYYTAIRDRGERPEIFHQIVKRVGHEDSERIGKIVKGLDVSATARSLWDLYHGTSADKSKRIADILLDLTEKQARVVREEFLLIPYKDLAKQLHDGLNRASGETALSGPRRTIGKSEVYEQKRQVAFRSRDDLRAVKYLLLGRSTAEVALIRRFYLDLSGRDVPEDVACIEAHLKARLLPSDTEKAVALLAGWSARREAEEIQKILYPHSLTTEIDDQLSDPKDSVDRDHTQGIGPFLRRFKKRRVWRGRTSVHLRVINAYELISERVSALSIPRFLQTNEALHDLYGFELDPTLFPSLTLFDARSKATLLHERLTGSFDAFELLKPMEYLDPRQCIAVQKSYEAIYGVSLKASVEKRLNSVGVVVSSGDVQQQLAQFLDGRGRWPLNIDILARYRGEEPEPSVWEHDYRSISSDEETAIALASLIDEDNEDGEYDRKILGFLRERDYPALNRIERAFFELTDPHVPLLAALQEGLSQESLQVCTLLLAGIDVYEVIHHLRDDASLLSTLRNIPAEYIRIIRSTFEKVHYTDPVTLLLDQSGAGLVQDTMQEDMIIENLAVLLTPEVYEFRVMLQSLRKDRPNDFEPMRPFWQGPLVKIMAFEHAYDLLFPRLRVHIKYAAARQALSAGIVAEMILSLEGVDSDVNHRLLECFDAVDIVGIHALLEENRDDQRVIEESFDLLFPDAPLRKSIKEMKVDLDLINETLLHLEGFYAREVADEVQELIQTFEGSALGQAILDLVAVPTAERPNSRIPEDINWMDEMVYQISIAYHRQHGIDLLTALRERSVPEALREEVTNRVFGHEVCVSARDLFIILKGNKEAAAGSDHAEERLCSYLETRGARHRDRLLRAYNSHWAHTPGFGSLLDDVSKFFRNPVVKKKMLTLLLGLAAERKQVAQSLVVASS